MYHTEVFTFTKLFIELIDNATPWEGREVAVPPPSGSYQGSRDSASKEIGPPETEYGRAIRCDAAYSGTL